jgi:hypothetical protein
VAIQQADLRLLPSCDRRRRLVVAQQAASRDERATGEREPCPQKMRSGRDPERRRDRTGRAADDRPDRPPGVHAMQDRAARDALDPQAMGVHRDVHR